MFLRIFSILLGLTVKIIICQRAILLATGSPARTEVSVITILEVHVLYTNFIKIKSA